MNYNNFPQQDGYRSAVQVENQQSLDRYIAKVMQQVFGKMTLGLLLTAVVSLLVLSSETLMGLFFGNSIFFWVLMIAELGLVFYLSARIDRMSQAKANAMFFLYSALNGLTLTPIFMVYTATSIGYTFLITAATFGAMALFGYVTKQDLSKIGSILIMALIGLIICTIINIFLKSTAMEWIISIAGVAIFVGLTAWDTQKIKQMASVADSTMVGKVATMGALSLYLDFINLFLYLLRFLGSSRD